MKRTSILAALGLLLAAAAPAQNVAVGERAPEIRIAEWIGEKPVQDDRATLLSFFHSSSRPCIEALGRLDRIAERYGQRMRVVVIARESPEKVDALLRPHVRGDFHAAYDDQGRTFAGFGVQYVPFAVIIGPKGRTLWQGNPATLSDETIEKELDR